MNQSKKADQKVPANAPTQVAIAETLCQSADPGSAWAAAGLTVAG